MQPDDLGARMNVGRMLEALGRFEKAETTYWKAKELFPKVNKFKLFALIFFWSSSKIVQPFLLDVLASD